jgi:hypothetical protein
LLVDLDALLTLVLPIVALGIALLLAARFSRRRAASLERQGQDATRAALQGPRNIGQYFDAVLFGNQPGFIAHIGKFLALGVVIFVIGVLLWVGAALVRAI